MKIFNFNLNFIPDQGYFSLLKEGRAPDNTVCCDGKTYYIVKVNNIQNNSKKLLPSELSKIPGIRYRLIVVATQASLELIPFIPRYVCVYAPNEEFITGEQIPIKNKEIYFN